MGGAQREDLRATRWEEGRPTGMMTMNASDAARFNRTEASPEAAP
jgi:hypothetical protein